MLDPHSDDLISEAVYEGFVCCALSRQGIAVRQRGVRHISWPGRPPSALTTAKLAPTVDNTSGWPVTRPPTENCHRRRQGRHAPGASVGSFARGASVGSFARRSSAGATDKTGKITATVFRGSAPHRATYAIDTTRCVDLGSPNRGTCVAVPAISRARCIPPGPDLRWHFPGRAG